MPPTPTASENPAPETLVEMNRLAGLSDGVFAIALTLLVLEIRPPEGITLEELPARLLELLPRLVVYLISFVVIGGAWGSHQRMLSQIKRGDGLLVWFNLFSLLFVTLIPASAVLLGLFPAAFLPIFVFAANVMLIQLSSLMLWRHAVRYNLVNPALDPRVVTSIGRRYILSAVAFALASLLVFLNSILVYVVWIGLFVLLFATDWLSWQRAIQSRELSLPLDGATGAEVHLIHSGGRLVIHGGIREGELVSGVFGGGVGYSVNKQGDLVQLELVAQTGRGFMNIRFPWAWGSANLLDWDLRLNSQIPVGLQIENAGGESVMDLQSMHLTQLTVISTASALDIALPVPMGELTVDITADAASLILRIPPGVDARLDVEKSMASVEFDPRRFRQLDSGKTYESLDYAAAGQRINMRLTAGVGSIKII